MKTFLTIVAFASFALPAIADEPGVYTDQDLDEYKYSSYDEDTINRREAETKQWEKEKELKERREIERREAEDRRAVRNRQNSTRELKPDQESAKEPVKSTPTVKKKRT